MPVLRWVRAAASPTTSRWPGPSSDARSTCSCATSSEGSGPSVLIDKLRPACDRRQRSHARRAQRRIVGARFRGNVGMTKQRMTGRFRGNALLVLWVCGVIFVSGVIVSTAMARAAMATAPVSAAATHGSTATTRAAADTFRLTATQANFAEYYPTYLANGYWSVASSLLGTAPTVAHMVGIMDYDADDVSRPAAIPSWNEIDYFDGGAWLNGSTVGA